MPIADLRRFLLAAAFSTALLSGQTAKVGDAPLALVLDRMIPGGFDASWSALRGKPVVLEFWATWCANCVAEIPHLNALAGEFSGIQFLSITEEAASVVEPFLAKLPISGIVGLDRQGATIKAFGVDARPVTFLIDRSGIIRGIMHPAQVTAPRCWRTSRRTGPSSRTGWRGGCACSRALSPTPFLR
jgi:thiol-disulfide isomerase/thioredoxin